MSDFDAEDYGDSNRAFLQAFLARSVLTFETAKPILAAIVSIQEGRQVLPNDITFEEWNAYISTANSALSPLDLEIRSALHQQTRERFYALVNTTSDALTQLATTYTADEIAFVKRLLDAMFDGAANGGKTEAMCLKSSEAMRLGKSPNRMDTQNGISQATSQGLSQTDAEKALGKLQQEGWLEKSKAGYISLSPRALMELKGWLVDTYNDPGDDEEDIAATNKIKFCHACKEIITVGQRCARRECPCRLHDICLQNFFRIQRSQSCPLCKSVWDGKSYVGEKAITAQTTSSSGARRSTNTAAADAAENEDEADET